MMHTLIIGGGIIGWSIAYELLRRGHSVTLVDRQAPGKSASLAGAGMIPASRQETARHPLEQLTALSGQLHPQWADRLRAETGLDNHYRPCGGLYLARTVGEQAALIGARGEWEALGIEAASLPSSQLATDCPWLSWPAEQPVRQALWVPGDAQFDNVRHLQALKAACQQRGVRFLEPTPEVHVQWQSDSQPAVIVEDQIVVPDQLVIAAGPWSESLLDGSGAQLPSQPVRGQMVRYQLPPRSGPPRPIVNEGTRYLVQRPSGAVLAGATIEEVGFDCRTTADEIAALRQWAESLLPELNADTRTGQWAGLRPATFDGFPYLGQVPGYAQAWVATGHFKAGLQLSPATGVVIADLIEGKTPPVDLTIFAPSRANESAWRRPPLSAGQEQQRG